MVASLLYDGSHVFVDVARVEYFNVLFHDAKSICCSVFLQRVLLIYEVTANITIMLAKSNIMAVCFN